MSDSLSSMFKQLEPLLSNKNSKEGISELLSLLQSQTQNSSPGIQNTKDNLQDLEYMPQLMKWFTSMSSQQDPKVDLIQALLPFLSKEKKKKATQCMKVLKFVGLSKFIMDHKSFLEGGKHLKNDSFPSS